MCSDAYQYETYGQATGVEAAYGAYGMYCVTVGTNIIISIKI